MAAPPHRGFSSDELLTRAYARVHTGMPASQLGAIGFDTAKAEQVSKLALMERFMPKNSEDFDALDPVVQDCYFGQADCNAYIFTAMGAQAVLLVEGGRVAWKILPASAWPASARRGWRRRAYGCGRRSFKKRRPPVQSGSNHAMVWVLSLVAPRKCSRSISSPQPGLPLIFQT